MTALQYRIDCVSDGGDRVCARTICNISRVFFVFLIFLFAEDRAAKYV